MNYDRIVQIVVSLIFIVLIILLGVNYKYSKEGMDTNIKYIDPTDFSVGEIKMNKYMSANLCNNSILYPINSIEVNYNDNTGYKATSQNVDSKSCDCQQFIQSP